MDWGLPECSGNSQGAKCSAMYKIWKLSRSDVYLVGRQPKANLVVAFQAKISTRFGGEKNVCQPELDVPFKRMQTALYKIETGTCWSFYFDSCHY